MSNGEKKPSGFLSSKYNKAVLIVVEIAVLLTVIAVTCVVLYGGSDKDEKEPYIIQTQAASETSGNIYETFSYNIGDVTADANGVTQGNNGVTQSVASGNNPGGNVTNSVQTNVSLADPSGWSTAQILSKAADAVNKTKSYKNPLTVQHKETFDATVTECSGGSIVKTVADMMVGWVVEPVNETLNYQNGSAVNSEGETIPILLPLKNSFYLSANGVTSASARISGNEYVLKMNIVEESVGMYEVPKHNASAIGYLDVANFDLSFLTVDSADITYKGSSVELHINADGYVTYAEYHIPMVINGSGHSGNISGSVTFDGEQTEVWDFKY